MSESLPTMNSKTLTATLLSAALLLGCGQSTPTAEAVIPGVERIVHEVVITSGEPVTLADLSIEGMSCEMMCGGSIKKALAALGVTGTEIKMSEVEGPDHAIVTYDAAKISDTEMIQVIHKLHDGQYKVLAVTITKEVKGNSASNSDPAAQSEDDEVSVYSPQEVVLPSIIALLGRILRS